MTVIDKRNVINGTIKEMFEFVRSNEMIKDDFQEYLICMQASNASPNQMEKLFLPYAFERRLNIPPQSVTEIFYESGCASNQEAAKSLTNTHFSVFEIRSIQKNGFELYNLINEEVCKVLSLTKMTSFRGLGVGDYISARIFKYNNEYYLIEIESTYGQNESLAANHSAIYEMTKAPWLAYEGYPEKEENLKQEIASMYEKFTEIYSTDEIITTNRYADEIISILCAAFNNDEYENFDMDKYQKPLENYEFFDVEELENNAKSFTKSVPSGFSEHTKLYDVGIIFDKEYGLYSIPFYSTFCKIFETDCKVKNVKECVEHFLNHDSVSDVILKRISGKYPDFVSKINEILETNYTFDELIAVFKSIFLKHKVYSQTSVLYHSKAFSEILDYYTNMQKDNPDNIFEEGDTGNEANIPVKNTDKIGRNQPCPCGSGKKYKNCCLNLS